MLTPKEIYDMFYTNGKRKDRTDPSKRVTCKVYHSKYFHQDTIDEISSLYGITAPKIEGLPFIAYLAYCGFSFTDAIDAWRKIANSTLNSIDSDLIKKAKKEIIEFIGILCIIEKDFSIYSNYIEVTKFENFSKLLQIIGIRLSDSKILCREKNFSDALKRAYNTKIIDFAKVEESLFIETESQLNFFSDIAKNICFVPEEDFIIYLLRYDLKKVN